MVLLSAMAACRARAPAQQPQAESCLDRELSQRGLNSFGDAPDTVYPGGTPLFDEKTGKVTDRAAYVFGRHTEIARACDAGP